MRRQIVSKLRRAGSALWTAMLFAWIVLLLVIAAIVLGAVLALAVGAYYVFGWWGVAVVAVFMVVVCFGKDRPLPPRAKGTAFPNDTDDTWWWGNHRKNGPQHWNHRTNDFNWRSHRGDF